MYDACIYTLLYKIVSAHIWCLQHAGTPRAWACQADTPMILKNVDLEILRILDLVKYLVIVSRS